MTNDKAMHDFGHHVVGMGLDTAGIPHRIHDAIGDGHQAADIE